MLSMESTQIKKKWKPTRTKFRLNHYNEIKDSQNLIQWLFKLHMNHNYVMLSFKNNSILWISDT